MIFYLCFQNFTKNEMKENAPFSLVKDAHSNKTNAQLVEHHPTRQVYSRAGHVPGVRFLINASLSLFLSLFEINKKNILKNPHNIHLSH